MSLPTASVSAAAADLASASEKSATSSVPLSARGSGSAPGPAPAAAPKLRSCIVCRRRKVRCDKLSPCSNCRRGNIACVFPSAERPPRWARRLERLPTSTASSGEAVQEANPDVGKVMDRLHHLEDLVKELSGQLEQANAAARSTKSSSPVIKSPGSSTNDRDAEQQGDSPSNSSTSGVQKQFGRLVIQDGSRSHYVSNGFWSRVNDEIDELKIDSQELMGGESDTSEEEESPGKSTSTQELDRTPSERHAFLFRHNLRSTDPDLHEFHPLPSQIPFLLNIYAENVNVFLQIVHIPTVTKIVRNPRGGDVARLTPPNEALMFSIYYAAVISMEEDDIMTSFGCTKAELSLKYRLGLEYALAKADFLNIPDILLVQAVTIFVFLVRRHDSSRFVWMMTGIVIRMAQALGLQQDGSNFDHLTPYEIEIRRRVWWALCILDVRAAEDQGSEFTITKGSFDTRLPLNLNDADIEPETKETPPERQSVTDMTYALATCEICHVVRRLMVPTPGEEPLEPEDKNRLLNEIYESLDRVYLRYTTETENITYWVAVISTRLVIAKMTLLIYLPVLFSSPSEQLSEELRTRLLVSAIEVAEYNHSLNSEKACRHWRWMFQTYTHWHAIVYLLIEISRRPWSPIVERAWVALYSSWLIPVQSKTDKNLRIWFPLRKLMANARKHRDAELDRLRTDPRAAVKLERDDGKIPVPASSGPFPAGNSEDLFREHWRKLVGITAETVHATQPRGPSNGSAPMYGVNATPQSLGPVTADTATDLSPNSSFEPAYLVGQDFSNANTNTTPNSYGGVPLAQTESLPYNGLSGAPLDWLGGQSMSSGVMPWLWADPEPSADMFADLDVNMELDTEVDWYNWVESAKSMEYNSGAAGSGRS